MNARRFSMAKGLPAQFAGGLVVVALATLAVGHDPSTASSVVADRPAALAQSATPVAATKTSVLSNQMPMGGPFGRKSVWKTRVSSAPLAKNSVGMVANLASQARRYYGGVAAFNTNRYNASFYTVRKHQPRVDIRWHNCQNKTYTPAGLLGKGGQFSSVPVPAKAVPASGSDSSLTIYQPGTDTMWDFWQMRKVKGHWYACWGGRIDRVSTSGGWFENGFGASATGLSIAGGTIGIKEARARKIDHAVALAIPNPAIWNNVSWPAQRSDGGDTSRNAIPEGTRFRLDPRIDVKKLGLHPLAAAVARAAQRYGFIVTDRSGCIAVVAESGAATKAATGRDPWASLLKGTPDYMVMKDFPWHRLQALPKHYGRS